MSSPWHLYLMGALYVAAGIMHFIKPKMYVNIMPGYLPLPKLLVYLSGIVEIVLGITVCLEATRPFAIFAIIAMLLVFLTVHFYMLKGQGVSAKIPKWILILRIPLQFILMYWAYSYL